MIYSKKQLHSQKESLLFCISCKKVGGAERRLLNLIHQVIRLKPEANIKLLLTRDLYNEYQKDSQLATLINNDRIHLYFANWPGEYSKKGIYINKLVSLFLRLTKTFKLKSYLRNDLENRAKSSNQEYKNSLNLSKISRSSWVKDIVNATKPGDHVHCFIGNIERNGGVLASQFNRKVVIEVTGNRLIPKIVSDLNVLVSNIGVCHNLHFVCVSKTVYENFTSSLTYDFLNKYKISCTYYKSPCLFQECHQISTSEKRKNIIVFAHRFVPHKNAKIFSRVIAEMYELGELKDWQVHFRGSGPEEVVVRDTLKSAISNGYVQVGWSSNLESELQEAKIFVSIIGTGSYPSQSVFQAMRSGNLLLLGNTGETVDKFQHQDIYFTDIIKSNIIKSLKKMIKDCENETLFKRKSEAMQQFYKDIDSKSSQAEELVNIHALI